MNNDNYSRFLQPVSNPLPISSLSKQLKENKKITCDYCTEYQESKHCGGGDGIMLHFKNECVQVEINYCPMCGKKLNQMK